MTSSRLEAVLAMHEEKTDAALDQLDKAERFARESQDLRVEGESADRDVTVTVDGIGQMVDLAFSPRFAELTGPQLSAAVLEAHAQAKRRLSFAIERLGEDVYGPGSPTAQTFAQSYRDQFGYEEDER